VIDAIYSDAYVLDAPVQTAGSVQAHGLTHGREGLKQRVTVFRTAFPDIHFTIEGLLADRNQVAVQYTFAGTQTGQFGELPPAGQRIRVGGMLVATVDAGQIQSAVSVFDSGDMLRQLTPVHSSILDHILGEVAGLFRHHSPR